jgi:DNA (cytosine-5)-methyltransferase 1
MGYAVGAADLCAAGIGAPHIRQRLFWVADSQCGRRGPSGESQRLHEICERGADERMPVESASSSNGVADTELSGTTRLREYSRKSTHKTKPKRTGTSCYDPDGRVADSIKQGLEGHAGDVNRGNEPGRQQADTVGSITAGCESGFWSNSILIPCADGKARRVPVESSLFPLAPGLPGRVGLLRGAGNTIVPQLAAEFIKAFI